VSHSTRCCWLGDGGVGALNDGGLAARGYRPRWRAGAVAPLLVTALLALAAAGCGQTRVVDVDESTFKSAVLDAKEPVLVSFYKMGCPLCLPVEPALAQLSMEYEGRVKVARFMIMTPYWTFPSWTIKNKYQIYWVLTVILFDKGVEVKRWAMAYGADFYRGELDRVLAGRRTDAAVIARPAKQPAD